MKTFRKFILVTLIAVAAIIIIFFALFFLNQDFKEFIFSSTVEEETVYAKGYSIKAWKEVKLNDNIERVIQLLGEPLKKDKSDDGAFSYFYSDQGPRNKSCRVRIIVFNKEGRVLKKIREFYID